MRSKSDWKGNFPTRSLCLEMNVLELTCCHRSPHGQLPNMIDGHQPAAIPGWDTVGYTRGLPSSRQVGWKAGLFGVFSINRINTLESQVSRLAKTSKYNKNRNQSSFSARVLGGRSWPQMKTLQVLWGRKTATQKEHKRHVFTLSMQAFPLFSSFSNLKVKEGCQRNKV